MPKFYICTFGCRCNQADSAAIRDSLCQKSLQETADRNDAELIVINTCTVTQRADQQARQTTRRLHRDNPSARIVVTGCYAERSAEKLAQIEGVSLVLGNADKERLAEIISEESKVRTQGKIIHSPLHLDRDYALFHGPREGGKTRPFLKIQDGCDARCSYCIVPSVRGPGRSARPEEVLAGIQSLVDMGFQEIVLTGVHLGAYGHRFEKRTTLLELLRAAVKIPNLGRLRLSGIEPMRFSRGIIRLATENSALAPHFHIPLQSGSDRVLRKMRRPYTAQRYRELLRYIHSVLPDAGLGTDVLVGFPGESKSDFQATCDLIRELPLTYLHVFPFSAREGSDAYHMRDQVPSRVARERARILRVMSREKNYAFRRRFLGQILSAVTLAKEEEMGTSFALTENYIHTRIPSGSCPPNRLIKVRIEEVAEDATYGSLME
ncbi:MAG: mtaB [Acidobacteria bacterium]|nr:mtaB [Acidobacteriota bacterium]